MKPKIGFVHITKTGGTNIKDKNKNKELEFGGLHDEDALFYHKKNLPCFAIMRDPIERYKSIFNYNTFGSNKYPKWRIPWTNVKSGPSQKQDINDINLFVDKHYNDPEFISKFNRKTQFRKQVSWLNHDNCYVILYDKKYLVKNIKNFLHDEFSINYNYNFESKNINTTNHNDKNVKLTQNSIDKIKKLYPEDVELYNNILEYQKRNSKFFCKIKEINSK
tara:strand:+ start:83 stop:742 length:660 start_codon:yes stop_codon:yes gene_type:complete